MSEPILAVQLYTLRDLTAVDFRQTLLDVAKIGYRQVELAGFGNLTSAAEARSALHDAGVTPVAAHVSIDRLRAELPAVLDECRILGIRHIVMPWLTEPQRPTTADGWKHLGRELTTIGTKLQEAGRQLSYHNHDFEFASFSGRPALEILFDEADPAALTAELDVYWIAFAGYDPLAYITRLAGRLPLLHLKDMSAGDDRRFAPVGEGGLDIAAICRVGKTAGVQAFIVEQDNTFDVPPLTAVDVSLRNLRRLAPTLFDSPGAH